MKKRKLPSHTALVDAAHAAVTRIATLEIERDAAVAECEEMRRKLATALERIGQQSEIITGMVESKKENPC